MNRKPLSSRQLQVMETLWKAKKSMTATEILKQNNGLGINTVQACLRSLEKKDYIEVGEIVYSGTVLSRSYIPIITREEYLQMACERLASLSSSMMISMVCNVETIEELEEIEKMIEERRKEIEEE